MKGCVLWNPFAVKKISPRAGLELGTVRSVTGPALSPLSYRDSYCNGKVIHSYINLYCTECDNL